MSSRYLAIISFVALLFLAGASAYTCAEEAKKNTRYEEVRLTNNPVIDSDPRFSPDMKMIVFCSVSNKEGRSTIHIMDADGKNRKSILDNAGETHASPSFTPDGKNIIFAWSKGEKRGISSVDLEGKNRVDFEVPEGDLGMPIVSPDGKTICYLAYLETQCLYVTDIETKKCRKLVNTSNDCDMPVFSNDSKMVFFVEFDTDVSHICRINTDGTKRMILTSLEGGQGFDNTFPSVTKNGKLVFMSDVKTGQFQLYVCDLDGKNQKALFETEMEFTTYAINPEGTKVVLFSFVGFRHWEFFLCDVASGKSERLTDNQFKEKQPAFSPDGKWILYVSDVIGNPEIFKILVDK